MNSDLRPSFPSTAVQRGTSWCGYKELQFLIVFGDSYSDVGFRHRVGCPIPSEDEPLGVEFPGVTYAEQGEPNWIGHLVTNYALGEHQLLVYDYAEGASKVYDVKRQIESSFVRHIAERPAWAPWDGNNSLFVTWVGINDSAFSYVREPEETCIELWEKLLHAQETLYASGARNFLFINVPPMDRSPAKIKRRNYVAWNTELYNAVPRFAKAHPDATVFIYSAWDTFNALLDDPVGHGFEVDDVQNSESSIWVDSLHPTSHVYDFVARDVSMFLGAQGAS